MQNCAAGIPSSVQRAVAILSIEPSLSLSNLPLKKSVFKWGQSALLGQQRGFDAVSLVDPATLRHFEFGQCREESSSRPYRD
jgi:hypothetical protein